MSEYTPRSHQLISHEDAQALDMERALTPPQAWPWPDKGEWERVYLDTQTAEPRALSKDWLLVAL